MHSSNRSRQPLGRREEGIALIVTLMVLMLVSVLMVGFVASIIADTRASGLDRDQTQAYAALARRARADHVRSVARSSTPTFRRADRSVARLAEQSAVAARVTRSSLPGERSDPDTGSSRGFRVTAHPASPWRSAARGSDQRQHDHSRPVPGVPRHHHPLRHHGHGARVPGRSSMHRQRHPRGRRSADAPDAADGRDSGVSVRDVLGDRPGVPRRRRRLQLSVGACTRTATCSWRLPTGSTLTIGDRVTAAKDIIRTHLPNGLATTTGYTGIVRIPTLIAALPADERLSQPGSWS